jgi:hypothetical protein
MTEDNVRSIFDEAVKRKLDDRKWPDPDMAIVGDDEAPVPVLEANALPKGWAKWITHEAAACNVPPDYVAGALIASASAWIGHARHVGATARWRQSPHLWVALCGRPSTGKTPGMEAELDATRTTELAMAQAPGWIEKSALHALKTAEAKAYEERWQSEVRDAVRADKGPPERPAKAVPPSPLSAFRLLAMDSSTEELQRLLAEQPHGLLFVRDELAGWFGTHDRYGGTGADRAFYNETWNGGSYVADRVKNHGAPVRIARASLAILGGLTPDLLREVLAGPDDGLAARFLYVWPAPLAVADLELDQDTAAIERQQKLELTALQLVNLDMPDDKSGTPAPRVRRLAGDAFALYQPLRRLAVEKSPTSRGIAGGWHGKTPGRLLRLALVYELLGWAGRGRGAEPLVVSLDAMERAGRYHEYAGKMLDRVIAGLSIEQAEADVAVIARGILAARDATLALNERALYQRAAWLRDRVRRNDAFTLLAEAGWIRKPANDPALFGANASGGRPRGDWDVNPKIFRLEFKE